MLNTNYINLDWKYLVEEQDLEDARIEQPKPLRDEEVGE